jgi:hypothetical protein
MLLFIIVGFTIDKIRDLINGSIGIMINGSEGISELCNEMPTATN